MSHLMLDGEYLSLQPTPFRLLRYFTNPASAVRGVALPDFGAVIRSSGLTIRMSDGEVQYLEIMEWIGGCLACLQHPTHL